MVDLRSEVQAMMNNYLEAFQAQSVADTCKFYNVPIGFVMPTGGYMSLDSSEKVSGFLMQSFLELKKVDYAQSAWSAMEIQLLSDNSAIVAADILRYRSDGSLLSKLAASYVLRKSEGQWLIVAGIPHSPSNN